MTVNFNIRLREDIQGEPGEILENDIINLGSSFFLEVVGGDFRTSPTGLMSTLLEIDYNPDVLRNLDDFETLSSPILTPKFSAIRTGEIDEETGLIILFGGGSLPNWGVGEAVGIGELESISILYFEPITDVSQFEINLNIDIRQTNFAGGVDADPNNIDFIEKTFLVNTPPRDIVLNDLISIPEDFDTNNPTVVATISATDPDENDSLSFSLVGEGDENSFIIEGNQLILRSGVSFDFETQSRLELEIVAIDRAATVSEIVTIPITDVDELPSQIELSNQRIQENADTIEPFPVGILSADDPEGETIFFTVTGGEDADQFLIQGNTLFLATGVELDFKADPDLQVEITGSDEEEESISQLFEIEVTEVNIPPSSIEVSNQTIPENTPTPVTVATVIATDSNVNDFITFSITGGEDADQFELVENQLSFREGVILDHETQNEFNVELTVTDSFGESLSRLFSIEVTDVNESPDNLTLSNLAILENTNTENGAFVGTLSAIDPENDPLTFQVVGGEDADKFEIRDNELWIASDVILDHEQAAVFTVEVEVSDEEGKNSSQVFSIDVVNINEPPSSIEVDRESFSISEETALFEPILLGVLSSIDPEGEAVTFSLSGGDDRSLFLLSQNRLFLFLLNELDRNFNSSLDVEITASDPQSNSVTRLISFPTIGLELSNVEVDENKDISLPIGELSTIDGEATEDFTYEIIGGENEEQFFLDENDLFFNPEFELDFETQTSLAVEISSTNSQDEVLTQLFTITVNDINEPPTDVELVGGEIPENANDGNNNPIVGTLSAIDPEGKSVSFLITGGINEDAFLLRNNRLLLRRDYNLDFETEPILEVEITASDPAGNLESELFQVTVTDVNEPPQASDIETIIDDDDEDETIVIDLSSLFQDQEESNSNLTYEIINNSNPSLISAISIDNNLGQLILTVNPNQSGEAELNIRAIDSEGLTAEGSVSIRRETPREVRRIIPTNDNTLTINTFANETINLRHEVTFRESSSTSLEVGFILLDAEESLPITATDKLNKIREGVTLFSILPESFENGESGQFDSFNLDQSQRITAFSGENRIAFYLITGNDLTRDTVTTENVDRVEFDVFNLQQTNIDRLIIQNEAVTFTTRVTETESVPLGAHLKSQKGLEVFDLSSIEGNITATLNFDIISVASFDNLIGFYTIDEANGRINDVSPNDNTYLEEVLKNTLKTNDGRDIILRRNASQGFNFELEGGNIIVPFLISNGGSLTNIPDQLDALPENSNVYTPFVEANSDSADHFRLLADNTFGIEDLPEGGDQDFNDMIFQLSFS